MSIGFGITYERRNHRRYGNSPHDVTEYCLLQLTNFTGSESVNEIARAMSDSFVF